MKSDVSGQKGFTLLELMIAMAIAGIVSAAMFALQQMQTRGHVTQEAVTHMHQNARGAMQFMTSEIRLAGCDPRGTSGARILAATSDSLQFSMDFSSPPDAGTVPVVVINFDANSTYVLGFPDGTTNQNGEDITYELNADGDIVRIDINNLVNPESVIAQNIDALDFVYLDEGGARLGGPGIVLGPNDRDRVRSIQVTVVARSDVPGFMHRHIDTQRYENQAGDSLLVTNPPNDDNRRILLSTEVNLRNR